MPAVKREANSRFIGESFQTAKGYLVRQTWAAPAAASATAVHAAMSAASLVTTGITNPDFPRLLEIQGAGATHTASGNVVINGTDMRDNVISDTIALNSNTVVVGVRAFKTVTSIDLTGVSGIDANSTVTVGIAAKLGVSRICAEDSALLGTSDGTFESTRPVITYDTSFSKNVVNFNTAPNGAHNFVLYFGTAELYAGKN